MTGCTRWAVQCSQIDDKPATTRGLAPFAVADGLALSTLRGLATSLRQRGSGAARFLPIARRGPRSKPSTPLGIVSLQGATFCGALTNGCTIGSIATAGRYGRGRKREARYRLD
jgi:hypothetical protein